MTSESKENMRRAISFESPDYVPYEDAYFDKPVFFRYSCEGSMAAKGIGGIDRWGITWVPTRKDMVCFPKSHPLEDLSRLDSYPFPDTGGFRLSSETESALRSVNRKEVFLQPVLHYGPFDRAWALAGMEALMVALLEDQDRVRRLAEAIADDHIAAANFLSRETDAEVFLLMDDLGSQKALLMAPDLWRETFKPALARLVQNIKGLGKWVYFHSCGHVMPIIEDFIEIGIDILNPVQARANDCDLIGREYGGKIVFAGGVDTQYTLMRGSEEEVRNEVRLRLRQLGGTKGGYIIGPDQSMPFPKQNLAAFLDETKKSGRYPLTNNTGSECRRSGKQNSS